MGLHQFPRLGSQQDPTHPQVSGILLSYYNHFSLTFIRYDVMGGGGGGKSAGSTRNYKETSIFLCFHVRKLHENHVFLNFLHLVPTFAPPPPMDKGLFNLSLKH